MPGYTMGSDVEGVIGIGTRGLWGQEGKILLIIDGQEMNELYYNNIPILNHYPLENIKRIEIIRGPGSSIYGGSAELGVINIITKSGADINGLSAYQTFGQMASIYGRENITFMSGYKHNDFDFALTGYYSNTNKTDQQQFLKDTIVNFKNGSSGTVNEHINMNLKYEKLKTNFIYDQYTTQYGLSQSVMFTTYNLDLKYDFQPIKHLTITPRVNYKNNSPWDANMENTIHKNIQQYLGSILIKYDLGKKTKLLAGSEFIFNNGHLYGSGNPYFYINNSPYVTYLNQAYFIQANVETDLFNITIGARYDIFSKLKDSLNSIYYAPLYNALAPRLGITKVFDKFHYKLLISKAFRAPSIGDIQNESSYNNIYISPEATFIQEVELGYKINRNMYATCNFFNINIEGPIVFYTLTNPITQMQYNVDVNYKQTGTTGAEFEFRYRSAKTSTSINYSYYHSGSLIFLRTRENSNKTQIMYYDTAATYVYQHYKNNSQMLGFPNHKITLNNTINFSKHLSLNNTFIFMSTEHAYTYSYPLNESKNSYTYQLELLKASWMWNIYLDYTDVFIKGLSFGAGVYDILNMGQNYVQPYSGGESIFPGPTREFLFRIRYNLNFKKED